MSTPSAGRDGRAPAATPTSDAPAMMPASSAGPFRDDPPVESARALAGAAEATGESKGGANPPGGSMKRRAYSRDPVVQAAYELLEAFRHRKLTHRRSSTVLELNDGPHRTLHPIDPRRAAHSDAAFDRARERLVRVCREDT